MTVKDTELDINRYVMINTIGEGSFSKVYRVKDQLTNEYYAAKVAKFMIDEDVKESEEVKSLFREINLMSLFNHPSILRFVGYYSTNFEDDPVPTLITEIASNGSLRYLIELENSGLSPSGWDSTKKLIVIYGIAAGMSYLHKHNVIHRDLKPENILIDEYLHPKISDFGLSKLTDFLSASMNYQSQRGLKGTPAYMAPEILMNEKYSKKGDVYAFGLIVYEIMTGKVSYENTKFLGLINKVNEGFRPLITDDVPDSYRELIECCWAEDESERPSFDEIVSNLKENKLFITEAIDEAEFYDYVDFIDNYRSTFNSSRRVIHFSEFIENQGRNKSILKIDIDKTKPEDDDDSNKSNEISVEEFTYPLSELNKLTKSCQDLVEESKTDPSKQFIVGKSLIEGTNGFPKNIKSGIKYIEKSIKQNFIESIIYYCEHLIKGDITSQNLQKSKKYLSKLNAEKDQRILLLKGKISYKQKKFKESVKYFEEGKKVGNKESLYQYGKMYFLGEGILKNMTKFYKFMNKSKDLGYLKADYFLKSYESLKQIKEFSLLPAEKQLIFINNNIKNMSKQDLNEFDQLFLKSRTTEKLFFNKSLASTDFLSFLSKYKKIIIEIEYPSTSFNNIFDLVVKIRNHKIKYIEIGIVFSSFQQPLQISYFSKNISYFKIDNSIQDIQSESFKACLTLKEISIPSSINSIGNGAFSFCSSLTQVQIPFSVTSIGNYAFKECLSLTQITIPYSVTSIGEGSFLGCTSLKQISIPSSVTSFGSNIFNGIKSLEIKGDINQIPDFLFSKNESLTEISIPDSVISLGNGAFSECTSLTQTSIPSSITSFGEYSFWLCSSLTQISLPSSLNSIGSFSFYGCLSLEQISIPSSMTSIEEGTFADCSSLTQILIPPSVTSIKKNAFYGCSSLTEISIPDSVISIGDHAFKGCSSLTEILIPESVTDIGFCVFEGCTSLKNISIPFSITKIKKFVYNISPSENRAVLPSQSNSIGSYSYYEKKSITGISIPSKISSIGFNAFDGCSLITKITVPSSVTSIGNYAFSKCSLLKQISFGNPSFITSIGEGTFNGCTLLEQISIPSSVTSIGDYAFSECSSLTQMEIPSSVTSIGDYAFKGCSSLAQISIPSSVTTIGYGAFIECSSLTQISIPSYLASIRFYTFFECSSLTQISIPSSVTSIGDYAFSGCSSLIQITIPFSVNSIGYRAFFGCSSLAQILFEIPSSVTIIEKNSFGECSSLMQISIPSFVTSIGDFIFEKCASLNTISIHSSVTSIGNYSFIECSSLTQISIPSSITSIGNFAFKECSSLTQITFEIPSSVTMIGEGAFYNCSSLAQISIPSSIKYIGEGAFYKCPSLKQIKIPSSIISIGDYAFSSNTKVIIEKNYIV